jgi:hypothetical protein
MVQPEGEHVMRVGGEDVAPGGERPVELPLRPGGKRSDVRALARGCASGKPCRLIG